MTGSDEKRYIYADNAATTKVSDEVLEAMLPYLRENFGNPSSIYRMGREAQAAIEDSRKKIAEALGCLPTEIFFTSGGSESDNWAIRGTCERLAAKGKKHIVTTAFEHHAVLHTCEALEKQGFEVTYLPVSTDGYVKPSDVENAIREDTAIVTVMYANNEIGTIQPIAEIAEICKRKKVIFHTDAVQAVGNVKIKLSDSGIDLLSLSGHKLHAQKGIGALYVRRGTALPNLIHGGAQERGKRAGTENVPAIVGLGTAVANACGGVDGKIARLTPLRNRLIDGLLTIPMARLNGGRDERLCGNCNISFVGVEGESLLLTLDNAGICASSGSACTSGSLDPSHVLLALGLKHEVAHGSLRITLSDDACDADIDYMLGIIPGVVSRLRAMSPLWERIQSENNFSVMA